MNSSLLSLTLNELTKLLKKDFGKGEFHAKSIYKEFYREGKTNFEILPNFSKNHFLPKSKIIKKFTNDDVIKFQLELSDNTVIETVIIPHKNRNTLCISSQVGCRMGCSFCSTGDMGYIRNLSTEEILNQVFIAKFTLGHSIDNIVFMGMGEPLDNYESVFQAVRILKEPLGFAIANRKITISTAGLIDGINKLAKSDISSVNFAISLHFAEQKKREKFMPIAKSNNLENLRESLNSFPRSNRQIFFIEYILILGINDSSIDADLLIDYLKGLPVRINLIAYNESKKSKFKSPSIRKIRSFQKRLLDAGLVVMIRNSRGDKIKAACGQLSFDHNAAAVLEKQDALH